GKNPPVAIERRYHDLAILCRAELRQRVGGQREAYEDRVDLIDADDARRIGSPDDVAGIDQAGSNAAVYRRADGAVVQLDLRRVDQGLIGLDACLGLRNQGSGGVDLLGGDRKSLRKIGIPGQIETDVVELRLVLELVGFGLSQHRFKRSRVDLDQQVAGADILSLVEPNLDDLTVDPGLDEHAVERL